ncbi:MAG: FecR family protein [Endomicrobia bacterium]|nr:FecR family protein [Endomicrobiia bacterium]
MRNFLKITINILIFVSTTFCEKIVIVELTGKVWCKPISQQVWIKSYVGQVLDENWVVKTEQKSKAVLLLYDGTKVVLSEKTEILLSHLDDASKKIEQKSGKVRFKISKLRPSSKFETITPTAVMSVRGTEFSVLVKDDLSTEVKVFEGIVNVRTIAGETIDLTANEKIEILPDLPLPKIKKFEKQDFEETKSIIKEEIKAALIPEVRMDMTKEQVQRAAAEELKLAEYQQGKSIIDVWGNRVRIEEYIVRKNMQPNQFKLVVLNERQHRFDYLTWIATFDKDLPEDLSLATKWLSWKEGPVQPDYYLEQSYTGISNTVDKVEWVLQGNVVCSGELCKYVQDLVSFKINGNEKINLLPDSMTLSYPMGKNFAAEEYSLVFKDGSWAKESYYWIDDNGKVPLWTEYFADGFLSYNQQLVFESDEFVGPQKKIDIVVELKIFLDSGIVQQRR